MINRRDFLYEYKTLSGRKVLQLLDRSEGNQLMKSDHIEYALDQIHIMNPSMDNPRKRMILIQTTSRKWEGYDPVKKAFAMLDAPSPSVAASNFISLQLQHTSNESTSSNT